MSLARHRRPPIRTNDRAWRSAWRPFSAGPAVGVATVRGDWRPLTASEGSVVTLTGLVVYAGGYPLWEWAVHRAPADQLGLLGSAVPVLSTLCLYGLFALRPAGGRR